MPLYQKMKKQPYPVDLDALWKELGVEREGDTAKFIDSAPFAKTRDAITFGAATGAKLQPAAVAQAIDAEQAFAQHSLGTLARFFQLRSFAALKDDEKSSLLANF